jgi:uncharacterized protein (TIGR02246 family)
MFRTALATLLVVASAAATASDQDTVAALDTKYQVAVKHGDADTMARILAPDFVLVLGDGSTYKAADLLNEARSGRIVYAQQIEEPGTQTVRVWGDTAVVTAKLWVKYTADGKNADRHLWFSDTYVRTQDGWRYVFGQASRALDATPPKP